MLQELLLALSGHPSPLFSKSDTSIASNLSASELALLHQLAHLGLLHQEIRTSSLDISKTSSSNICRAVAASILNVQLNIFQQKILDVERSILSKNSTYVGAYDIVPLSGIATAFAGWNRRLSWLKEACQEMQKSEVEGGAHLIDWLRAESKTGYPDIESIASDLIRVAERAWLRQLATWILYGRIPSVGAKDFLIQFGTEQELIVVEKLRPSFVTRATSDSILFIGRSLELIKNMKIIDSYLTDSNGQSLVEEHIKVLSSLKHPISGLALSRVVSDIRRSLARNALHRILSNTDVLRLLNVLKDFFLLGRGEFSVALVAAADQCLQERHIKGGKSHDVQRLGGVMIKNNETTSVLNKAMSSLAALQSIHDDNIDEVLEIARSTITLQIKKRESKDKDVLTETHSMFDNVLLSTPTVFSIEVKPPLNLFLNAKDISIYSTIHAYLLGIRRAHIHLTELWKLSVLRRHHPTPPRPLPGKEIDRTAANARNAVMRSVWTAVSSATFFLTQLSQYLQGEVVATSWMAFQHWLQKKEEDRDPEILTRAHQAYLSTMLRLLLLEDLEFAKTLRNLLSRCDQIVALVKRLDSARQTLQAFESVDGNQIPPHLTHEEEEIKRSLGTTTQALQEALQTITIRLSDMDRETLLPALEATSLSDSAPDTKTSFVPWKGSGARSLLMRLDFQAMGVD